MTDGYILIHLESGSKKHYYAIFEYELLTERTREGDRKFAELGNEIFSYIEKGYVYITYKKGQEYESPHLDDLLFNTIEEAYKDTIIEVFYEFNS